MSIRVSAVIPSRNGLDLLREQLPVLLREGALEIIVVDDCSGDGSEEAVRREFPSVKVLTRKEEPGFCHAVNLGMRAASTSTLLLLNNDVIPEPGCIEGLAKCLSGSGAETVAAVPVIRRPDGTDDGMVEWGFRRGLAFTGTGAGRRYPSGACALWKRWAWESLGGLSTRYAPIYWEDADMGERMHGAGMRMIRFRGPGVLHRHAATMGASHESLVLRERNRFIFMGAWCSSPGMRAATCTWMPIHLARAAVRHDSAFIQGYREFRRLRHGR